MTRSGAFVGQTSGEISLAFSTANRLRLGHVGQVEITAIADGFNPAFNPLFEATVEAVHEAVLNSMFAATTVTGLDGTTVHALPADRVVELLRHRGALAGR